LCRAPGTVQLIGGEVFRVVAQRKWAGDQRRSELEVEGRRNPSNVSVIPLPTTNGSLFPNCGRHATIRELWHAMDCQHNVDKTSPAVWRRFSNFQFDGGHRRHHARRQRCVGDGPVAADHSYARSCRRLLAIVQGARDGAAHRRRGIQSSSTKKMGRGSESIRARGGGATQS
jgi:hypothetical protein